MRAALSKGYHGHSEKAENRDQNLDPGKVNNLMQ